MVHQETIVDSPFPSSPEAPAVAADGNEHVISTGNLMGNFVLSPLHF